MSACNPEAVTTFEQLEKLPSQWNLYKELVAGVPESIKVRDVCVGAHWILVEAECGWGVSMRVSPCV